MRKIFILIGLCFLLSCQSGPGDSAIFKSNWPTKAHRTFIGPDYWANRLQDWQIKDGRLECIFAGANRNVNLLTRQLGSNGNFKMSVVVGRQNETSSVGLRFGIQGMFNDFRDSAVHGKGINAALTSDGFLYIGETEKNQNEAVKIPDEGLELVLTGTQNGDNYEIELLAQNVGTESVIAKTSKTFSSDKVTGNIALFCHNSDQANQPDGLAAWFRDWQLSGDNVIFNPNQSFGPIMWSQYTTSRGVVKLTAQMAPIGATDDSEVTLLLKKDKWKKAAVAPIDKMSRTATFKLENWDAAAETPYRLVYKMMGPGNKLWEYEWDGTIRREPMDKEEVVVAGFTGNNDLGFPNADLVKHVNFHNPDVLFFSGDQIYEGVGGYGAQRSPIDKSALDYLRKWYLYGWAYRDMLRNIPSVAIPDDHDVYHGNVWGEGGKATIEDKNHKKMQDSGGYKQPPEWVNMVQRTQCSHLPDPFDPTPIKQGIGVYYTNMEYAGISFAILEDRKWKSSPSNALPKAQVINGWAQNKNFNAAVEGDVPGAILLGDRQLDFLEQWAAEWDEPTWMKVVLSQTIFANVATLPEFDLSTDEIVPKLRILPKGEYPDFDVPVSDMDSNSWPQSGRNKALEKMRKGFAFHYAGDQHLGSFIQYGVDDWNDAGYAFCVPAISNVWPRRWFPKVGGLNRVAEMPKYSGDFYDGFGNKMTVHAVSNPVFTGCAPTTLYDRATGYGIARFNRDNREITLECWPRECDPSKQGERQYPGWPIKIKQLDNYSRKPFGYLTMVEVSGITNPVVQVINEATKEIVYTVRVQGQSFTPMVFENGRYTVKVGKSTNGKMKEFSALKPTKEKTPEKVFADFS
jgi:alkaline phosphatase D